MVNPNDHSRCDYTEYSCHKHRSLQPWISVYKPTAVDYSVIKSSMLKSGFSRGTVVLGNTTAIWDTLSCLGVIQFINVSIHLFMDFMDVWWLLMLLVVITQLAWSAVYPKKDSRLYTYLPWFRTTCLLLLGSHVFQISTVLVRAAEETRLRLSHKGAVSPCEPLSPGCERSELQDDDLVNELWCRFRTVSRHWKKVPRVNEDLAIWGILGGDPCFSAGVMLGWRIVQLFGFSIIAVGDGPLFE